jgi:hypothetical protein
MNHASPDQLVAYVEFIRAVEQLLADAEAVKERHKALNSATAPSGDPDRGTKS